jgi:hypothetical protein
MRDNYIFFRPSLQGISRGYTEIQKVSLEMSSLLRREADETRFNQTFVFYFQKMSCVWKPRFWVFLIQIYRIPSRIHVHVPYITYVYMYMYRTLHMYTCTCTVHYICVHVHVPYITYLCMHLHVHLVPCMTKRPWWYMNPIWATFTLVINATQWTQWLLWSIKLDQTWPWPSRRVNVSPKHCFMFDGCNRTTQFHFHPSSFIIITHARRK